jgi:hypothetical protein
MQKNIINKQKRNMIGKIHHNPANGELHQNHIVLPPFRETSICETNRKIRRFDCIDEIEARKDTGAEKKGSKLNRRRFDRRRQAQAVKSCFCRRQRFINVTR